MTATLPPLPESGKFRKLPVVIDAYQLPAAGRNFPESFHDWCEQFGFVEWSHGHDETIEIETLEGTMVASPSDWIIKGVAGEFYPCKLEIFAATYEPALSAVAAQAQPAGVQMLIDFATGLVHHIDAGGCPDFLEGHNSRDPDCPVCRAIDAAVPAPIVVQPETKLQFKSSEAGRSYVADFFTRVLGRHDFGRYIKDGLAADFACALAPALQDLIAAKAVSAVQTTLPDLLDVLRTDFEKEANPEVAGGLRRSLRGTYINAPTARDWKWFRLGANTARTHLLSRGNFGTVDCIGIALDLESSAAKVESQTAERAMRVGANALRNIAALQVGGISAPVVPAPTQGAES